MARLRVILLIVVAAALATAGQSSSRSAGYPETIPLPNGFQPEGIAIGRGTTFYVGSIPTGAIYRGDLQTGQGSVLVQGRQGRSAIGIDVDSRGRIFVAGGQTGMAFVYDARTGRAVKSYRLVRGQTFVNDVVVTRDAAWFTDSVNAVLYRVPIASDGGLGRARAVLRLSGDLRYEEGFNVNGIDATRDGRTLVIVQTNTGLLFTVNPGTGATTQIDLGGTLLMNGDGILLSGRTLYVVQNQENTVARVVLARDLRSGRVAGRITDPDLDVPTTIDRLGNRLYAVNARFGTQPGPTTAYHVVQLPAR